MSNVICEVIPSIRNKNKINVNGYLMVKDKNRKNLYYWCCEKRKTLQCRGRATTLLIEDGFHQLQKFSDHNHAAEASRAKVAKIISVLKERAQKTNTQPVQIIQNIVAGSSQEIYQYLPSRNALRQSVKRIRRIDAPAEPQSLESFVVPENLQKTLDGDNFLIKDSTTGHDRILIFTTIANINYLKQSSLWIMDATFKKVPTIFKQLYTIHGCVGNEKSCILPLVYVLMSNKTERCYQRSFRDLINFSKEQDIDLQPQFILTNLEVAATNAIYAEFQEVQNQGCHFHLSKNIYHKIQSLDLAVQYGTDENFSLLIRHIPALAFLPPEDIPAAFDELRANMPSEANEVMEWFEDCYIRGRIIRTSRSGNVFRTEPSFPPSVWSVADNIEYALPRIRNSVEAWHRRWETLVGSAHTGLFKVIKEIQKDQAQFNVESVSRRVSLKNQDCERESRIREIYNNRDNRSLMEFLRGIAHNLSL